MFRSSVHAVTEALDNTPFITLFIRAPQVFNRWIIYCRISTACWIL